MSDVDTSIQDARTRYDIDSCRPEDETWVHAMADEIDELRAHGAKLQHLVGVVSLYVDGRYVERQLTTEEKELWADAIDAWRRHLHGDGSGVEPYERWWRESAGNR